jgi:hypothetical protein
MIFNALEYYGNGERFNVIKGIFFDATAKEEEGDEKGKKKK